MMVKVGPQKGEGGQVGCGGEPGKSSSNLERVNGDVARFGVDGDHDCDAGDELLVAHGKNEAFQGSRAFSCQRCC